MKNNLIWNLIEISIILPKLIKKQNNHKILLNSSNPNPDI